MPNIPNGDCQKPSCHETAENTYRDPNGNTLRLCERHYYEQVTGTPTFTSITRSRDRDAPDTWFGRLFKRK